MVGNFDIYDMENEIRFSMTDWIETAGSPFIIMIGAYLMTSMLGGFLIYYILQWAD